MLIGFTGRRILNRARLLLPKRLAGAAMAVLLLLSVAVLSACGPLYDARRASLKASATEADYGPQPTGEQLAAENTRILAYLKATRGKGFSREAFAKEMVSLERDIINSRAMGATPSLVWISTVQVTIKDEYVALPFSFAWEKGRIIAVRYPSETMGGARLRYWQY